MRIPRCSWLCLLALAACQKKDITDPVPTGPVTQAEVNKWVLDSMRYYYLWNDGLPGKVDTTLSPLHWFASLRRGDDPFSLLYNSTDPSTLQRYFLYTYGIDFSVISWPAAPGGALGVIRQVVPGGAAAMAGLQRGQMFTHINGTALTGSNAAALSDAWLGGTQATLKLSDSTTVDVYLAGNYEYPVYHTLLQSGGRKVGYVFYDAFNDDLNNSLVAAFSDLKTAGAQELVLDLRYNTGGSLSAAAVLTALIAPNVNANTNFLQLSGNGHLGTRSSSFASIMAYPERGQAPVFSTVQPAQLSLPRVFILTTHKTISAAELTINCLKAYTQVIQIGETTYGKDKAAIVITDQRSVKRLNWVLEPLTYRLLNAKGSGGYTAGIAPQYVLDEMGSLPLRAFGDPADPLLAKALGLISGSGRSESPATLQGPAAVYISPAPQAQLLVPGNR